MQGIIKKIIADKNFGFISQEGVEKDIFFHKAQLDGVSFEDIKEGDHVVFEVENTDRGLSAISIKRA